MAALFSLAHYLGPDGSIAAEGAEQVMVLQRAAMKNNAETDTLCPKHMTSKVWIELNEGGMTACAGTYFTVIQKASGMCFQPLLVCRYGDSFAINDGQWQFTTRQVIPELFGDVSQHLPLDLKN